MDWLQKLLEADEVTPSIDSAISGNAQGITNINKADKEVLGAGASTDPNEFTYDKTDSYSATTDMSDIKVAGTIQTDYGSDMSRSIKSGSETPSLKEYFITPDECRNLYTEALAEFINESTEEINEKYKTKIAAAKEWKKRALEREKKAAKKAAKANVTEGVNAMLDEMFSGI